MRSRHYDDDWTIERWRSEPRPGFFRLDTDEAALPPLWKDLTLASVVAGGVWLAAAVIFA